MKTGFFTDGNEGARNICKEFYRSKHAHVVSPVN